MGGNNPSRFSVEDEEGGGVTLLRGIRLSDRVINRMKLSSKASCPHLSPASVPAPSVEHMLPLLTPPSPLSIPSPPPVRFHPLPPPTLDSALPPPSQEPKPSSAASLKSENNEVPESLTPPSAAEPTVLPPPEAFISAHKEPKTQTTPQIKEEEKKPVIISPSGEIVEPPKFASTLSSQSQSFDSPPVKPVSSPLDPAQAKAGASPSEAPGAPATDRWASTRLPPQPSTDGASSFSQCDTVHSHVPGNAPPPELEAPPAAVVEEDLRKKIRDELQKGLEEEMSQKRLQLQHQLEEIQALTRAEATAAAQVEAVEQVKKTLEAERASYMEKLTESMASEKMKAEDAKLRVQLYAQQLEEREKEMKKQEELYKQHVSKLEAKCAEFYRVSAENFQESKKETNKRFVRFHSQPLCGDLQLQILKCYKENPGRTLTCSPIASAYMQCVDNIKKDKLITGG